MRCPVPLYPKRRCATLGAALFIALCAVGCDDSPVRPDETLPPSEPPLAVHACFTMSPETTVIDAGQMIELDAGCSENVPDGAAFLWDLRDGRTENGRRVRFRYTRTGTFEIELTVRMGDELATAVKKVVVRPRPEACFTYEQVRGDTSMLCTVAFDASCSIGDVAVYVWFFEGGRLPPKSIPDATITTSEPEIVYSWGEDFECKAFRQFSRTVRLTVVDDRDVIDEHEEKVVFLVPLLRP